jgi:hypothetical protein
MKKITWLFLSISICLFGQAQAATLQEQKLNSSSLIESIKKREASHQNIKQETQTKQSPISSNPPPETSPGRTYNHFNGARVLPPKQKRYPILDQLEYLLFPSLDFKKESPGKRLERLELSVFGNKQKGTIVYRVKKLKGEVESWQIANVQTMENLNNPKGSGKNQVNPSAYSNPEMQPRSSSFLSKLSEASASRRRPQIRRSEPSSNYYQKTQNPYPPPAPGYNYGAAYGYTPQSRPANPLQDPTYKISAPLINRFGMRTIDAMFPRRR